MGMGNSAITLKKVLAISYEVNIYLVCSPAIPLPGISPSEMKIYANKKISTRMFIVALVIAAKDWK